MKTKTFAFCTISAFLTFLFFGGNWNMPIMAWIFPLFFLIISRKTKPAKGYITLAIILMIGGVLKFPGVALLDSPLNILLTAAVALLILVPFIIDKVLYNMLGKNGSVWQKFASTLIFPISYALLELVLEHFFFGAYFSLATSQTALLFFLENASLIGQAGISFLIAWTGSMAFFVGDYIVTNGTLHKQEVWNHIKPPVLIFLCIMLIFSVYGGIKLAFYNGDEDSTKVAIANGPYQKKKDGTTSLLPLEEQIKSLTHGLKIAKSSKAEAIAFNEGAFFVKDINEPQFKELLFQQAKDSGLYILIGYIVQHTKTDPLLEDKIACISPDGKIQYEYLKSHLIPFLESGKYVKGNYVLPTYTVDLLKNQNCVTAGAIGCEGFCATHFNELPAHTDIFYNPTTDSHGIGHSFEVAMQLRAIEHGMSIISPSYEGFNAVYNYLGRQILRVNLDQVGYDTVTFAYVPTKGQTPIYSYTGMVFDWAFPIGLIILAFFSIKKWKKDKKANMNADS